MDGKGDKPMKTLRRGLLLSLVFALLLSVCVPASAGGFTGFEEWAADYPALKTDDTTIALTPGADETAMNFAWLSPLTDVCPRFSLADNAAMLNAQPLPVKSAPTITGHLSHKAGAENLNPGSVYYYTYTIAGKETAPARFTTGSADGGFTALIVADTQIGRSGDETLDEILMNDTYGWNRTLEVALAAHPDTRFILSAGDQVESANRNEQYNLFLAPKALRSIPVATTMGNHDFYHPLYRYRFNNPNEFEEESISSPGGSGYWFRYGKALIISVDANTPWAGRQERLVEQAVAANPDALWRIVLMHNSIYGAGGGVPNLVNLWRFYARVFDRFAIDLVVSGHDHVHCRTQPIRGGRVVAPGEGTIYFSANSASGSKYSNAPDIPPAYAANVSQLRVPCYSVLSARGDALILNSYRADTNESIDDELVLTKQAPSPPAAEETALMRLFALVQTLLMVMRASF